jgi:hypothetical protein
MADQQMIGSPSSDEKAEGKEIRRGQAKVFHGGRPFLAKESLQSAD